MGIAIPMQDSLCSHVGLLGLVRKEDQADQESKAAFEEQRENGAVLARGSSFDSHNFPFVATSFESGLHGTGGWEQL